MYAIYGSFSFVCAIIHVMSMFIHDRINSINTFDSVIYLVDTFSTLFIVQDEVKNNQPFFNQVPVLTVVGSQDL